MTDKTKKKENELPYIDKKEVLFAELRRLHTVRNEKGKKDIPKFKKSEKVDIFNKTNGICHICGCELDIESFSITGSLENGLPACKGCKMIYDNYMPSEIKWMLKIGLWAKTQVEYETDIGKEIATEIIEIEKDREGRKKEQREPLQIDVSKYPIRVNSFIGNRVNREYKTIKEFLFWSYANLSMATKAVDDNAERYTRLHYSIRAKLFKGLMSGEMNPRSMFYDEKVKLQSDKCCVYCGKTRGLQLDHIIPKNKGGKDTGENLVWACRSCNASKNDTDLMEWYGKKGEFPPLRILRNYMKLVIQYCSDNNIMDAEVSESKASDLPFSIEFIPLEFPQPTELILFKSIEVKNEH